MFGARAHFPGDETARAVEDALTHKTKRVLPAEPSGCVPVGLWFNSTVADIATMRTILRALWRDDSIPGVRHAE